MIEFTWSIFFGFFQIIVQAVAAVYAYKIYAYNRLNRGWVAMIFALILMTLRRITALLIEFKLFSNFDGWLAYTDRIVLPSLISILLFIGLYVMFKDFENFEVVEKKVVKFIKKRK